MMFTRLSGVLLAVALPFAVTGVASARPDTALTLTVVSSEGWAAAVQLFCDPPRGPHPNARRACAEIHLAQGDFDSLPGSRPMICTMQYVPVVATAEGTWRGVPVDWEREFGNPCTMRNETGRVFAF
ncbi:subtilase-type protease inhibitor [Actinophytocola sp.]|uniref:subtilase-type protease inhibitor n=1 Tax=Actinophytocola sp. TaxID=1872138 RepID=UPI002ED0DC1A